MRWFRRRLGKTEDDVRDARREKLLRFVDKKLDYRGYECTFETFVEERRQEDREPRTRRVTHLILVD